MVGRERYEAKREQEAAMLVIAALRRRVQALDPSGELSQSMSSECT